MSKAIITIEDKGEMGVNISLEFEPALKNDETRMTPAQHTAMVMLEALKSDDSVEGMGDESFEFED